MNVERRTDAWGRVIVNPESAFEVVYNGLDLSEMTVDKSPEMETYNKMCKMFDKPELMVEFAEDITTTPEEEHARRSSTWLITEEILQIQVRDFLLSLCKAADERARVNEEMDLFEERDLVPLLQLMMYLVDHFRRNKVVWGVGRGSSVSSFCLYLIGVHKLNSLKYGLDIKDFLK